MANTANQNTLLRSSKPPKLLIHAFSNLFFRYSGNRFANDRHVNQKEITPPSAVFFIG